MLYLVLYRLAYPVRLNTLRDTFGKSSGWVSTVFNDVIIYLYKRWKDRLAWNPGHITYQKILEFSDAIERLGGGPLYWGYLDGTVRTICRPIDKQRLWYSGYKKAHVIQEQAVVTPDGLVASMYGPYIGSISDPGMLN